MRRRKRRGSKPFSATRFLRLNVRDGDWLHTLWDGDGIGARVARAALTPAELVFGAITATRASLYSSGILATHATSIPALSVGNLTVGGTGKTPVAAYLAARLRSAGAAPGIVLRGYGGDEPLVHRTLNPDVPVVISPDRLAGIENAKQLGCDVVVLDDAFQHRRASRVADVVVVSADSWHPQRQHLLPAGPWRERLTAARRASLVIVTRKAASRDRAESVAAAVARVASIPSAVAHLDASELRAVEGAVARPIDWLDGQSILAIAAIGDPGAFAAQLTARGAKVTAEVFRDHHQYSAADAAALAAKATQYDLVVCTLKDAVKLGPLWPGPSPLWYVSQRVTVERGGGAIDAVLSTTLVARSASTHPGRPGPPGPLD
jgi:tetraacyldisaccharide 4'-kinase